MTREELLARIAEKKAMPDPGFEVLDKAIAAERQKIAEERKHIHMSSKGFMALYEDMKTAK